MRCPACDSTSHILEHHLTRARLVCRRCGHQRPWMDEPEWRALLQIRHDALRGAPAVLRQLAEAMDAEAA